MKKIYILIFYIAISHYTFTQSPLVSINFMSHNEENDNWNDSAFYFLNRSKIVSLANYFHENSITWNMQSDWTYLSNAISRETSSVTTTTEGKNILMWMYENMQVEMDPHAHESEFIYPDVVKLMDSIGLPESKIMGGTIYNDFNGINIWTNLVDGQYGNIFPSFFWEPEYMMGGGTPNHTEDLLYYGFWHPQSPDNYLTDDISVGLVHLAIGCEMKIWDTSSVNYIVSKLHDVIDNVQSGIYPASGIYLQNIFFEQAELNNTLFYNKLIQIADSANAIVASGNAAWKTFKQVCTEWETTYNKEIFQWECGAITDEIEERIIENTLPEIYPNPAHNIIFIKNDLKEDEQVIKLYSTSGFEQTFYQSPIDISNLPSGIYFAFVNDRYIKVVIE